jgi:hypothetical protein
MQAAYEEEWHANLPPSTLFRIGTQYSSDSAAQQALAPDAATRQLDRGDFSIQIRSNVTPIYRCGAAELFRWAAPHSSQICFPR